MPEGKFSGLNYATIYVWIGTFIVIIGVLWYWGLQVGKKTSNNNKMKAEYQAVGLKSKSGGGSKIQQINSNDPKYNYPLKDYYIATSYNTCCAGDFQDSYVTLDPIAEILESGARVLDFEIYSVDDKAVVAASPYKSFNLKGTYNSLPIDDVLSQVASHAFAFPAPNPSDPLFLMFRIKSNRKDVYLPLAQSIVSNFGSRLLDARYSFGGRGKSKFNVANTKLSDLQNQVIIIASQDNNNYAEDDNKFWELVNISSYQSGTQFIRTYDAMYPANPQEFINLNKTNLCICLPDLSEINNNPSAIIQQNMGCQMTAMSYQKLDQNMLYYINFFEDNGSAFVLKPERLRPKADKPLECPPPQNPALSMAGKQHTLTGGFQITL